MKMRKGLKQKMATALITAMMAGMTVGPAWADENPVRQWVNDGDDWYYYNDKGNVVKDQEKYIHGNWYGFDRDGVMYSNELFASHDESSDDIREEKDGDDIDAERLYAFEAGNLAKGWVKLDEGGKLYTKAEFESDAEPYWYHFKNGSEEKAPKMDRGIEKPIDGNRYRFYNSGKMYQNEWYYDEFEGDEYGKYYYQLDGPKARNKWLPLEDDNGAFWYHFDEEGEVHEYAPMASSSNVDGTPAVNQNDPNVTRRDHAPARQVHAVSVASDSNMTVTLGESVYLKFMVTLASDSNTDYKNFDEFDNLHQFEPGSYITGRFHVDKTKTNENGICSVKYVPKKLTPAGEDGEEVKLSIDGIVSPTGITVKTVMAEDISTKKEAVNVVIDSVLDGDVPAEEARETILAMLGGSEADKKTIQNTIVENDNYAILDNNYAKGNAIQVSSAVQEDALSLLPTGNISLVGGALNAEPDSKVELKVAPSAEVPVLKQEFKNKVSFDIKLAINDDDNQTSLAFPVKITMPVPTGFNADSMSLFHIHGDEETEVPFTKSGSGMITFTVTGFSDFVFAQNDTGSSHGSSGGGGGSSSSSTSGVVTTDSKKGKVNSLTGIIIGSGDGYSKWVQEAIEGQTAMRWKLQYADGTYAAGSYVLDEQGNPKKDGAGNLIEQPLWELISGAWYAFGVDGYARSGMVFDPAQNGWFYIDINSGMKTGWQQIDGKWYYFNTTSDGSRGIMYVSRNTPDGYAVGADGVWNGQ